MFYLHGKVWERQELTHQHVNKSFVRLLQRFWVVLFSGEAVWKHVRGAINIIKIIIQTGLMPQFMSFQMILHMCLRALVLLNGLSCVWNLYLCFHLIHCYAVTNQISNTISILGFFPHAFCKVFWKENVLKGLRNAWQSHLQWNRVVCL